MNLMAENGGEERQASVESGKTSSPSTHDAAFGRGGHDFFISYAGPDERWAEWIAWTLENYGYRTTLQKWDLVPGANFVLEMHSAAARANRTVAVLSPAYFDSKFGQAEWAAAFRVDPTGASRVLIPVRVANCTPPGLLASICYIDLVGVDAEEAKHLLLQGVQSTRAKPGTSPLFPGAQVQSLTERIYPTFPNTLPPIWMVPRRSKRIFLGRETSMQEVRNALPPGRSASAVLWGLGGIGKTQLAAEYLYANRSDYDCVLWIDASNPKELHANFAALTHTFALNLPQKSEADLTVRMRAVRHWLCGHSRWLLVIDSVDTDSAAQHVEALHRDISTGHIVVTTRWGRWSSDFTTLEVRKLQPEVAAKFLMARTALPGGSSPGEPAEALAIATELDGLPLALEHAASFITERRISFHDYLARISSATRPAAAHDALRGQSIYTTWAVTVAALSAPARAVLQLACWLSAEPIPRNLFMADKGSSLQLALKRLNSSESEIAKAIESGLVELANYSMIDLHPRTFECHRLVATVQREWLLDKHGAKPRDGVWRRLTQLLSRDDSSQETCCIYIMLAMQIVLFATNLDQFEYRAAPVLGPLAPHMWALIRRACHHGLASPTSVLASRLGGFLMNEARHEDAEQFLRLALAIDTETLGPTSAQVTTRLHNLALLLERTDRNEEAERLLRQALEIGEVVYGPHHSEIAIVLHALAIVLKKTNRVREAELLLDRALTIDRTTENQQAQTVALRLKSIAQVHHSKGEYGEAERLFREALQALEDSGALNTEFHAAVLNDLAMLLSEVGSYDQAEPLMRQALVLSEALIGSKHPGIARKLVNLALILKEVDQASEAEVFIRRALALDRENLGSEHSDVALDTRALGALLRDTARPSEAEPLLRSALAILERVYGGSHPEVATSMRELAKLLVTDGRLSEAETLCKHALAIDERCHGPDHKFVADGLLHLASVLRRARRFADAEMLLRRALTINQSSCGLNHPSVAITANNLADLLCSTSRLDEAEPLARLALQIHSAHYGLKHLLVGHHSQNLARILKILGRTREAEKLLRDALEIFDSSLESTHPDVVGCLGDLVQLLAQCDRLDADEKLFRRASAAVVDLLGPDHPLVKALGGFVVRRKSKESGIR